MNYQNEYYLICNGRQINLNAANFIVDLSFAIGTDIDSGRKTNYVAIEGFGNPNGFHIYPLDPFSGRGARLNNKIIIDADEILREDMPNFPMALPAGLRN